MLENEESMLLKCKRFLEDELLTQEMKDQFSAQVKNFWDEQITNYESTIEYTIGQGSIDSLSRDELVHWLKENKGIKEPTMADNLSGDMTKKLFDR